MLFSGYKVSTICIYLMNFSMAWDSFATFLTIWYYWNTILGFSSETYGLVFAVYALAQAICAPFLGYWADKMSIRIVVLFCLAANMIGDQSMIGGAIMVTGRIIAGGSAATIILGLSYVTQLSASEDRIKVMNYYRVFGFIGRFVSAVVSIGFLFTPNIPIIPASSGSDVDGYCYIASFTLPPVTTIVLDIGVLIFSIVMLRSPPAQPAQMFSAFFFVSLERGLRIAQQSKSLIFALETLPFWKDPETLTLFKYSCLLNVHFWAGCLTMWTIFSQIIPISIIVYGISADPEWFWLPYVPFFLGLVLGWASVIWPLSKFFTDKQLMLVAPLVIILSLMTYIQFSTKSPQWVFYVGTTVLYTAFNVFNTAYQSFYSKVVGKTQYVNTMMSSLLITGSFGQFCGPFLTFFFMAPVALDVCKATLVAFLVSFAFILSMANRDVQDAPGCIESDPDAYQCCPDDKIYSGCTFQGINFCASDHSNSNTVTVIPLVMLIMTITTLFQYWFVRTVQPQKLQEKSAEVVESSITPVENTALLGKSGKVASGRLSLQEAEGAETDIN